MRRVFAFPAVLLLGGLATASAQSLAEIAEKEKERRAKNEATQVQSFNDSDLGDYRGELPTTSTEAGQAIADEPVESEEPQEPESEEEEPTQTEAYWRERLTRLSRRIADLEAQLNRPGFLQDPDNMLKRQRLERDLAQARRDRDALIQEARRAGVPPGWVR